LKRRGISHSLIKRELIGNGLVFVLQFTDFTDTYSAARNTLLIARNYLFSQWILYNFKIIVEQALPKVNKTKKNKMIKL